MHFDVRRVLRELEGGEPAVVQALWERFAPRLLRRLRSRYPYLDAEDLLQESFVRHLRDDSALLRRIAARFALLVDSGSAPPGQVIIVPALTFQGPSRTLHSMAAVKISSVVDEEVWDELRELVAESNQTISGALTEAIADYVRRRRVRPAVLAHLEDSLEENEELGRLLAQ